MIDKNALLFSLTANKQLTEDVAKILGIKVSPATVSHFADGEILCESIESVREKNCYITLPALRRKLYRSGLLPGV